MKQHTINSKSIFMGFILLLSGISTKAQWENTWLSGSSSINQQGSYGTKGIGSTSNTPGARFGAISWQSNDTLYLFGGIGYDANGNSDRLNDLWKYNTVNGQWTWVSGSNTHSQQGSYGTKGTGSTSNIPGARYRAITWQSQDTLFLFGGYGRDGNGNWGYLNDLWKYNTVNGQWTWLSGSNFLDQNGSYGTQGIGSTSNIPGAREGAISWQSQDTFYLFGGVGYDGNGNWGYLNDLWKYNTVNGQWTWLSGTNSLGQNGSYGTKGMGSTSNIPGARYGTISWKSQDTLYLFGGVGMDGNGGWGMLNDLWKFNTVNGQWTWVSGSNLVNQQGSYGTQGIGSINNNPGSREVSISWQSQDTLYLFGGVGYDANGNSDLLNDLWKFNTVNGQWTWVSGSNLVNQQGSYGTQGISSTGYIGGLRYLSVSWESKGSLYLFGGHGAGRGYQNDLWRMNPVSCTRARVSTSPRDSAVCLNNNALFGLIATGDIDSFGWNRNTGSGWQTLTGTNNDTIMVNGAIQSAQYRAIAYAACGNDTTVAVNLTVNTLPIISGISSSRNPSVNGYAPYQCANLTATASGNGSVNYVWSPSGSSTNLGNPLAICPTSNTTYTLTVTDSLGCQKTANHFQMVTEASSPYPGRVIMCYQVHRRGYTRIDVYASQVPQYLNAGASFGVCNILPKRNEDLTIFSFEELYSFYPNPTQNRLNIEWYNVLADEVKIELIDITGRVVKVLYDNKVQQEEWSAINEDLSDLTNGFYWIKFNSNTQYRMDKVQVLH